MSDKTDRLLVLTVSIHENRLNDELSGYDVDVDLDDAVTDEWAASFLRQIANDLHPYEEDHR